MTNKGYRRFLLPRSMIHLNITFSNCNLKRTLSTGINVLFAIIIIYFLLLIHFTDKPLKPNIQGNLNILVDSYSELNCSSFLTTAPDHYARLRPLSFTWYVNNTQLDRETSKTLKSRVTRNHKYNQYSCTARDKLESNRSDPIIINPLCK